MTKLKRTVLHRDKTSSANEEMRPLADLADLALPQERYQGVGCSDCADCRNCTDCTACAEYDRAFQLLHQGFLDGRQGEPPRIAKNEYEDGWLYGHGNRTVALEQLLVHVSVKRGDTVRIKKGAPIKSTGHPPRTTSRSYKIHVHDVYPLVPAHRIGSDFVPPVPARVVWVGKGGYWHETPVFFVEKVE